MRKRILVVEDDRHVAKFFQTVLEKGGYQVDIASSVTEAEQSVDQIRYDAYLIDYRLSGDDGFQNRSGLEVVCFIRSRDEYVGIVMATGTLSVRELDVEIEGLGVWAVLEKPCSPEQVLEKMAGAIELTEMGQEGQDRVSEVLATESKKIQKVQRYMKHETDTMPSVKLPEEGRNGS